MYLHFHFFNSNSTWCFKSDRIPISSIEHVEPMKIQENNNQF